jgi:hypothetical protein
MSNGACEVGWRILAGFLPDETSTRELSLSPDKVQACGGIAVAQINAD